MQPIASHLPSGGSANRYPAEVALAHRVNAERLVVLGWSRAILMQLAHPLVAAGVLEHSAFRGGVFQAAARLHQTVRAMLSLTFGDDQRRAAALSAIQAIHRRVHGTLPVAAGPFPAGTRYSAEDPRLLLWVHATLLDSTADIYQRLVAPLETFELDQLCVESEPLLEDLGGDPKTTPRTWGALDAYLADMLQGPVLTVTPEARALGEAVLSPRAAGLRVPLGGLHELLTVGLLPVSLREKYGYPWSPRRERRFHRTIGLLRALRRVAPGVLAHWRDARVQRRSRHPS